MDINANASALFGEETKFGGYVGGGMETFQDTRTLGAGTTKGPNNTSLLISGGALAEIAITSNTKAFLLAGVGLNRISEKVDTTPRVELLYTTYYFPELSAGLEHSFGQVWKIDDIFLRAGVSKFNVSPANTKITYVNIPPLTEIERQAAASPAQAIWTLGTGLKEGKFVFDATVTPSSLNGIYIVNGAGPALANITLSYQFK